tara:strand:+ start:4431 stop:4574 length:144 start_codon:yes stop_codon:yes gene_type:complete
MALDDLGPERWLAWQRFHGCFKRLKKTVMPTGKTGGAMAAESKGARR